MIQGFFSEMADSGEWREMYEMSLAHLKQEDHQRLPGSYQWDIGANTKGSQWSKLGSFGPQRKTAM